MAVKSTLATRFCDYPLTEAALFENVHEIDNSFEGIREVVRERRKRLPSDERIGKCALINRATFF